MADALAVRHSGFHGTVFENDDASEDQNANEESLHEDTQTVAMPSKNAFPFDCDVFAQQPNDDGNKHYWIGHKQQNG